MKARILLAVAVLALASACSGADVITAPDSARADQSPWVGTGN